MYHKLKLWQCLKEGKKPDHASDNLLTCEKDYVKRRARGEWVMEIYLAIGCGSFSADHS
jgi:hypothetical protein